MSIEQKLCEVNCFQFQSMLNVIRSWCISLYQSKLCVQEFWYFVSGLDIQLEQSENDNSVCRAQGCRLQITSSNIPISDWLCHWYEPVVKVTESKWVRCDSRRVLKLSAAPRPFAWHWAPARGCETLQVTEGFSTLSPQTVSDKICTACLNLLSKTFSFDQHKFL